jgi:hypothetical protein
MSHGLTHMGFEISRNFLNLLWAHMKRPNISTRIWALRCGSMAGIKSRRKLVNYADNNPSFSETVRISFLNQKVDNEEELLILAHLLLRQTMDHFVGAQIWTGRNTSDVYGLHEDDIYKLVQMQLSLMYDIMYTKLG